MKQMYPWSGYVANKSVKKIVVCDHSIVTILLKKM
jgi:hypothetical protein